MENKILLDSLNFRYATKVYDSQRKVSDSDFEVLLETLRLAPSSYGLQPWKFLVIKSKEIREKLKVAAYSQTQLTDASHIIVICSRKNMGADYINNFVKKIALTRNIGEEQLSSFKETLIGFRSEKSEEFIANWTKRQAYIALGFILEAAALKRIDATPMEGFDSHKFDEILGLTNTEYTSTVICALGYRSKEDKYA
ncbi:MAG: NAD(P)H-dependent oxidoreductase, partial [archaeon]